MKNVKFWNALNNNKPVKLVNKINELLDRIRKGEVR